MKKCNHCKEIKNIEDFYHDKSNNSPKFICKRCTIKYVNNQRRTQRKVKYTSYWWRRRYEGLRERAKKRGKEFNLTFVEAKILWTEKNCYYCEKPATVQSIDRVNNSKPYEKNNCVMACWTCNRKKSSFSLEEIKNFYDKMLKYH